MATADSKVHVREVTEADSAALRLMLWHLSQTIRIDYYYMTYNFHLKNYPQLTCVMAFQGPMNRPVGICLASKTYCTAFGYTILINGIFVLSERDIKCLDVCSDMLQAIVYGWPEKNFGQVLINLPRNARPEMVDAFDQMGFETKTGAQTFSNHSILKHRYTRREMSPPRSGVVDDVVKPYYVLPVVGEVPEPRIVIRLARSEDMKEVFPMIKEVKDMHLVPMFMDCKSLTENMNHFTCIVAEDLKEHRIIGVATLSIFHCMLNGKSSRINDFLVAEKHRRGGLGIRLLKACFDVSRKEDVQAINIYISQWNTTALTMFRNNYKFNRDYYVPYSLIVELDSPVERSKPHLLCGILDNFS